MTTIKLHKISCLRCGHEWVPTIERIIVCAKCRSPYWNIPKQEKNIKE